MKLLCHIWCAIFGWKFEEFYAYKSKKNGLIVMCREPRLMPKHNYIGQKYSMSERV